MLHLFAIHFELYTRQNLLKTLKTNQNNRILIENIFILLFTHNKATISLMFSMLHFGFC